MKTIRINGIEQSLQDDILFGEMLRTLNLSIKDENKVISSIQIDGKELSEEEEDNLKQTGIHAVGEIDLFTSNPADLAYQTLDTLETYLDRLLLSIQRAAQHYRSRNYVAGDSYFVKSVDGLDLFVQTIGGIKLAIRIGLHQTVAITEAQLMSIMNDLLEAKRQNNYVFMAELLEKDLTENLNEWKTQVFKVFRSFRSN